MNLDVVVSKQMDNNTIFLSNEGKCIMVDPSFDREKIEAGIGDNELIAILLTHAHFDHFATLDYFADKYRVPVYAHKNEIANMKDDSVNMGIYYGIDSVKTENTVSVADGQELDFGYDLKLKCIRVEGHTSDSICFYSEADKFLLSGDTIFCGSIGRVDFYKNDMPAFLSNIKENLLVLPEDTVVYPGHGPSTSIAVEKTREFYENY